MRLLSIALVLTGAAFLSAQQSILDRAVDKYVKETSPKEPEQPKKKDPEKVTAKTLVGKWYSGGTVRGIPRADFEIMPDGSAVASAYFTNSGRGPVQVNGNRVEIQIPANWGPFSGRPYLKWTLQYKDGVLEGEHTWWDHRPPDMGGGSWYKPYRLTLKRK